MVTKDQAMTLNQFYTRISNPRHSHYGEFRTVRRSGQTKTWKRDPNRFHVPVKYGLYESLYIDQDNASEFYAEIPTA